jgi:hypothetical protein
MNEVEWLAGLDPEAMLAYLAGNQASERKLRLFACACVRRHWTRLRYSGPRDVATPTETIPQRTVVLAERWADGLAGDDDLEQARQSAEMSAWGAPVDDQRAYQAAWATLLESALEAAQQAREFIRLLAVSDAAGSAMSPADEARLNAAASAEECRAQGALLCEIFGNPFRQVKVDPGWLSISGGAGAAILRAIEEEQRFEELPYLGDALEDAGCRDETLLRHLRQPCGHVRGCWAVDLLVGRK